MSKFQITFVFNAETEVVTELSVTPLTKKEASRKKQASNTNARVELNGSSLALNDDVLDVLGSKVDSKLVLSVVDGKALIVNPRLNPKTKGGNKVTGKLTIACRGKLKDDLEALGTSFAFRVVSNGVIELIPADAGTDVVQMTEEIETDIVITEEDLSALAGEDEEEIDDLALENL